MVKRLTCIVIAIALVTLIFVSPLFSLVHGSDSGSWNPQVIDPDNTAMNPSLAFDPNGYPHISYYAPGNYSRNPDTGGYLYEPGTLKYASWDGAKWQIQTVDLSPGAGLLSSLVIDKNGNPHIAYIYTTQDKNNPENYGYTSTLKYASWIGSRWNIETIEIYYGIGGCTLVLDSHDNPHIAYQNIGVYGSASLNQTVWAGTGYGTIGVSIQSSSVKYASWIESEWIIVTVDSNLAGYGLSFALDSNDNPHLTYYSYTHYTDHGPMGPLNYASCEGSSWTTEQVDNIAGPPEATSLSLDSTNRPHIAIQGDNENYLYWTGSAWTFAGIDNFGTYGAGISLIIDSNDKPYVSYSNCRFDSTTVKFASWNGSSWAPQVIADYTAGADDNAGFKTTSIALDSTEKPVIAYVDHYKLAIAGFDKFNLTPPTPSTNPNQSSIPPIGELQVSFNPIEIGLLVAISIIIILLVVIALMQKKLKQVSS